MYEMTMLLLLTSISISLKLTIVKTYDSLVSFVWDNKCCRYIRQIAISNCTISTLDKKQELFGQVLNDKTVFECNVPDDWPDLYKKLLEYHF